MNFSELPTLMASPVNIIRRKIGKIVINLNFFENISRLT